MRVLNIYVSRSISGLTILWMDVLDDDFFGGGGDVCEMRM